MLTRVLRWSTILSLIIEGKVTFASPTAEARMAVSIVNVMRRCFISIREFHVVTTGCDEVAVFLESIGIVFGHLYLVVGGEFKPVDTI